MLLLIPVLILAACGLGYLHYINNPLVTAPGQLEIYAYDLSEVKIIEYKNAVSLSPGENPPEAYGFMVTNTHKALPLTFSVLEEDLADAAIVFGFSATDGEFSRRLGDTWTTIERAYLGQEFKLENNQTVNWENNDPQLNRAYIDIVVYADGHIVGCATLCIGKADPTDYPGHVEWFEHLYFPKLLGSVSFPKQDGRYQKVTEEDVQGYFAQWKQN